MRQRPPPVEPPKYWLARPGPYPLSLVGKACQLRWIEGDILYAWSSSWEGQYIPGLPQTADPPRSWTARYDPLHTTPDTGP